MGFFRDTLLECAARCTQTCLGTLAVERLSTFPPGPGVFVASSPVSYRLAPPHPTHFFRTALLRSCFGLVYRSLFSPLFPTWHPCFQLVIWRTSYDTQPFVFLPPTVQRSSYRSAHIVPFQFVPFHFHCCFFWDPF